MSLQETLQQLYSRRRFGIRPGVERVTPLLSRLGNPEQTFSSIHVVGTNGKGSTAAFLSSILTVAGYRTAQFSSPHLVSFTERFRINDRECSAELIKRHLDRVLAVAAEDTTFFEIITATAACIFSEAQVEVAVMEAGMGGGSDATAAFPGLMTLVTMIGYDHEEYLGHTLEQIAAEKAGIFKPGTAIVCAGQQNEAYQVIVDRCRNLECELFSEHKDFAAIRHEDGTIAYKGIHTAMPLPALGIPGRYQQQNVATALAAAELLRSHGFPSHDEQLRQGVLQACWPGRMELIQGTPPILLDGAHNPDGAIALVESLADFEHKRLRIVAGVCSDKDAESIFLPLRALSPRVVTVTPAVERALPDRKLAELLSGMGMDVIPGGTVGEGIMKAQQEAGHDDLLLICGSLFVVGEAKAWLSGNAFTGIRG